MRLKGSGRASVLALIVVLGGCSRNADTTGNHTGGAAEVGGSSEKQTAQPEGAKLSAYTMAYNKLIDTFGLTETASSYMDENIAGKSASDSVSITDGWVDQGLAAVKKARRMPGSTPEMDVAADRLITALDKVLARLAPLKIYYDAKSYKEDNLGRGKREDPLMRADFTAALNGLKAYNMVLKGERGKQSARDLATLKARGDMLGYDTKLALQQGEALVDLFNTEADLKNPEVIGRANAVVTAMEATLAEQRQQFATTKAKATAGEAPDGGYSSVADALTSMIGEYRDVRQSHDTDDMNAMVREYNRAVESANGINH